MMSQTASTPPSLTAEQLQRLARYGRPVAVEPGEVIFRPGDTNHDLVVVESGEIEIVTPALGTEPEEVLARYGPHEFLGELNFLTGQTAYLLARVITAGLIHRITRRHFRDVMAEDPELSDLMVQHFHARRDQLSTSSAARCLTILGSSLSAESLTLRTFAARQRLPHRWVDIDSPAGQALISSTDLTPADLPAVITPRHHVPRSTPGDLADVLGLSYHTEPANVVDLAVIGAGPAGLAAAVYGASEGLTTIVLDAIGIGGQAASSSRIENYLGFPSGISGHDLTQRASLQAMKFGATLWSPCTVTALDADGPYIAVTLRDGGHVHCRAVVIATGAHYRTLPLPRWADFEGRGIFYAATELEAHSCSRQPVTVIGGANSAGQAALFLSTHGCTVTLAVRSSDPTANMSAYLGARLDADPHITVRPDTEVTALHGDTALQRITLRDNTTDAYSEHPCGALFCFIGAQPATEWLREVDLDSTGSILTDIQIPTATLGATWATLHRPPLPFETNIPGIFAVGDVRSGSTKRVATAVGEGAAVIRSVHTAIARSDPMTTATTARPRR
ncbi:FAD-dependent oxidoreductase [Mycobacterium sp. MBM]|nr:FAD-dependent oxidoreductase [Mycobacterium sp. MBM]